MTYNKFTDYEKHGWETTTGQDTFCMVTKDGKNYLLRETKEGGCQYLYELLDYKTKELKEYSPLSFSARKKQVKSFIDKEIFEIALSLMMPF